MEEIKYHTHSIGFWYCERCGRRYSNLENICFFCYEKPKQDPLPPRHQYIFTPQCNKAEREFYIGSINLDE